MTRNTRMLAAMLTSATLVLAGCGSQAEESDTHTTDVSVAAPPKPRTPPKPPRPTEPAYPTDASVEDYCAAQNGAGVDMTEIKTIGAAADAFEEILGVQRKTGMPADMPEETRKSFAAHLGNGKEFVADLRDLPADDPISTMQTDTEFSGKWGGGLKVPYDMVAYFNETC